MTLLERQIGKHPWKDLRVMGGDASEVPEALVTLSIADSPQAAEKAYWLLENRVVVQGALFSSAPAVVDVLMAMLSLSPPRWVTISILELLFQILSGESHESESARGRDQLASECRSAAMPGFWLICREVASGERAAALDVLAILDGETAAAMQ